MAHFTDASKFGGAEQMIVNLLSAFDRRRWTPVLLHHEETGLRDLLEPVRRLGMETVAVERATARRSLARYLRENRPAVFHAHLNWPLACEEALRAAAFARTPAVVATQQLFAPMGSVRRVLRHKLLSLAVDRYIAVSHDTARMLRRVVFRADRKVRVVHNGIRTEEFERPRTTAMRESLAGSDARPLILTLARLVPQKGIEFLIDAAVHVPDALFLIAGEGPDRRALEERAAARGLDGRVRFLGYRADAAELLACCDLFVLPSLYEGLPVSVLEAMAAGRPAIATRIGGTEEAVEDGITGLLVPPSDASALAAAIRRVLARPSLAASLGQAARERVRRDFSIERVAARTTEVYEEALEAA